jgi:DNA-binding winged helix-turn-helix (wHTH) protein/Flp pilus assembly protein TadD
MQPHAEASRSMRFDAYSLDLRAGELHKHGRKIRLQEQPFQILAILLEQPGQVVTREQLRERLWPEDTFVDFDHSLSTAVKKLRQALNDEAVNPRYVETLPRRGYRYIGPAVESVPLPGGRGSPDDSQVARPASAGAVSQQQSQDSEVVPAECSHSSDRGAAPKLSARRWPIVAPLALLVAAIASGILYYFHRAPVLGEKDTIVIADFANSTGDPVFDDTLKQGLAVQLAQSPFLSVVSDQTVRDTLLMMEHRADDRLTPEVVRDLCQRVGSAAYLSGSIANLGSQYIVGLRAVNCRTGEILAQEQVQALRKEEVLNALDRAVIEMRTKLGESLSSVRKFDVPLPRETTASLDALKAFSSGRNALSQRNAAEAIPFFKRAIELDPNFAMAYDQLGTVYNDLLIEPGVAAEYFRKAYELRDRVSEREKLALTATYYGDVTGEIEKSIETSRLTVQSYPNESGPHNSLAFYYEELGEYDKALAEEQEEIRLAPNQAVAYSNLMEDYTALNRLEDAKSAYRQALAHHLDGIFLHDDMYAVAFLQGDTQEMNHQVALTVASPGAEDIMLSSQSDTEAFYGRLQKARELSSQAVQSAMRRNQKETAAIWQLNAALREAEFGNSEQATERIKVGLAIASGRGIQTLAALTWARLGDAARTQAISAGLQKQFPSDTLLNHYWLPTIRASIELSNGNAAQALTILGDAAPYEFGFPEPQFEEGGLLYPIYVRGQAYLALHRGAEAALEFQKILDHHYILVNAPLVPLARFRRAQALALTDDRAAARASYQDFFTLWKDADPDIPILKQAKAEYAKLQ